MTSPTAVIQNIYGKIKKEWRLAFASTVVIALLIHMPVLLSDIPNHDGLDSMYFDQNMITSGRWFLMVACGFSSFYTIPWIIGILGICFLGIAAAAIMEILEVKKPWAIVLCSGLLAAFPALASTFAYVFTLDGYMLALLLAVLAVLFTKKYRKGFLAGGACLAFSLGTYQAYLPFAIILSVFSILMLAMEEGKTAEKVKKGLQYLYMGIIGVVLYYVILQVLLKIQGKELASYQGINDMTSGTAAGGGLLSTLAGMYRDFLKFTLRGNVLYQNIISCAALLILLAAAAVTALALVRQRKWWKNPFFFVIIGVAVIVLPLATNIILMISPDVTYHLLMRYQWVLYLIGLIAFAGRHAEKTRFSGQVEWAAFAAAVVLVFFYGVTDNVAYSNLQKRYEKTYAYCVRLLDRIEQTPGYYQGIPIAMIGVVGEEQYPQTDITLSVTSNMIGMNGDSLLYTGENYRKFMQHYLGATLNILPAEAMEEMYYSQEYIEMDSFPGENSIRIIDGIMYIKTENVSR
ncbi:MAG: glucosyltransferase domain-containing protein [Acetatifactor sp.]